MNSKDAIIAKTLKTLYDNEKDRVKKGMLFMLITASKNPQIEMIEENILKLDVKNLRCYVILPKGKPNDTFNVVKDANIIFIIDGDFSDYWVKNLIEKGLFATKIFIDDMNAIIRGEAEISILLLYKIYKVFILGRQDVDAIFNKEFYDDFVKKLGSYKIQLDNYSINKILSQLPPENHPRNLVRDPLVDDLDESIRKNNIILIYGKSASGKTSLAFEYSYYNYKKEYWKEQIYYIDVTLIKESDTLGLFLEIFSKLLHPKIGHILLIMDDLHANLSVTQKLAEIINFIQKTNLSNKLKFLGILWPEFVDDVASKFIVNIKKLNINPETVRDRLLMRLSSLDEKEREYLKEYVEDNLVLLNWAIKLININAKKVNIRDIPSILPQYIYENIKNKVVNFDDKKLKQVLFIISALGQYEIDSTKKFLQSILPSLSNLDISNLIKGKVLRVKGSYLTLGHRSYCKAIFDYLLRDEYIRIWMEKSPFRSVTDIILEYLYTLEPIRIWSILKKIYMYTGIKTSGNVVVDIWQDMDYLVEKIIYQQSLDPTWNKTPSSAMFAIQALCGLGYKEKAKDSIKFLRSIYTKNQNKIDINTSSLSTQHDFKQIKAAMIEQDKKTRIWGEDGKSIDEEKFHKNWVMGLILCAEAFYGEMSQKDLLDLALRVENSAQTDQNGRMFFYPARVPWCTARILIGLGLCGRNIENSETVRKISEWLMNHPSYNNGRWQSGTGTWNTWIETTALVIQALLTVGVSPYDDIIKKSMEELYSARAEWTQKGKEIDGVTALQAYSYARGDLTKVLNEIMKLAKYGKDVALWINATKPANETLNQSCLVSQTASGLIEVMWRYIQEDLPLLLENFDMKINYRQKKPSIFISYSKEDEAHNSWVSKLADSLGKMGYSVHIDIKDLNKYKDLTQFMEKSIEKSEVIVVVCTPTYKNKADERIGGVGYESRIISYEIYKCAKDKGKIFVPILRKGDSVSSIPNYLKGYEYVDFRNDNLFIDKLNVLNKKIKQEVIKWAKP